MRGGKIWIQSAKPRDPVATIHDGLIVGGFEFSAAGPKRDTLNNVATRFVANDREYQTVDGPLYRDTDFERQITKNCWTQSNLNLRTIIA